MQNTTEATTHNHTDELVERLNTFYWNVRSEDDNPVWIHIRRILDNIEDAAREVNSLSSEIQHRAARLQKNLEQGRAVRYEAESLDQSTRFLVAAEQKFTENLGSLRSFLYHTAYDEEEREGRMALFTINDVARSSGS